MEVLKLFLIVVRQHLGYPGNTTVDHVIHPPPTSKKTIMAFCPGIDEVVMHLGGQGVCKGLKKLAFDSPMGISDLVKELVHGLPRLSVTREGFVQHAVTPTQSNLSADLFFILHPFSKLLGIVNLRVVLHGVSHSVFFAKL